MSYGRAIFGDNQFLGVNHSSQARAMKSYERFSCIDSILEILGVAYEAGVRDFMFTTHDRYLPVFDEIRRSNLFHGMFYTPCLPYAYNYWNELSSRGVTGLFISTLAKANLLKVIPASLGLALGRTRPLVELFTKIEIFMCRGLAIRGVFLLNLAFDLLVAMELYEPVEDFFVIVKERLKVEPGVFTMNHPKSVGFLCDGIGIRDPWICSNYNASGFRMNPSKHLVEASFANGRSKNIAMSVFSAGSTGTSEALQYVVSRFDRGGINAVLFGSGSPTNIRTNVHSICFDPQCAAPAV
jgi:hypothetical protein